MRKLTNILLWCLALIASAPVPSSAGTQQGGAANVQSGGGQGGGGTKGFACGAGMSWTMDGGVAKCKVPDATGMPGAPCAAVANYAAGQCLYNLPAAGNGVTVSATNIRAGYTGGLSVTCQNGTWGTPTFSCSTPAPTITVTVAPASVARGSLVTVNWTTTNAIAVTWACNRVGSGTWPSVNGSRTYGTPSLGPETCTATATGNGGKATASFGWDVVAASCAARTYSNKICSYPIPQIAGGASAGPIATTTPGYVGSVVANCDSSGNISYSAESCDPLPPGGCAAGSTTTSGACQYTAGALTNGQSLAYSNSTAGYTGSATASCNSGAVSWSGKTCTPAGDPPATDCNSSYDYGACVYYSGWISDGQTQAVANSAAGYTGAVTAKCVSGNIQWSNPTCSGGAGTTCAAASTTSGACFYSTGVLANGATQAAPNSTAGYSGSATATCNSGTISWGTKTCTADPSGCASANTFYGNCSFSAGALSNGGTSTVNTSTSGYTGTATATCNAGVVSWSGQSCTPQPPGGCAAGTSSYNGCEYSVGALNNGQWTNASNTAPGYSGGATAACSGGALIWSGQTCTPSGCAAAGTTYNGCSFASGALTNGGSSTVNTSTAGYSGSATATCSGNTVIWSGKSCTAAPLDCAAAPNYATPRGCIYDVPATPDGQSATMTNKRSGYIGTISATCSGGAWTGVTETCTFGMPVDQSCAGTSIVIGACTYAVPPTADGAISAAGVTAPGGYTGVVYATCNGSIFSYGPNTCTPPAAQCSVGGVMVSDGTRMISNTPAALATYGKIGSSSMMVAQSWRCAYVPTPSPAWSGGGDEYECRNGTVTRLYLPWICNGPNAVPNQQAQWVYQ